MLQCLDQALHCLQYIESKASFLLKVTVHLYDHATFTLSIIFLLLPEDYWDYMSNKNHISGDVLKEECKMMLFSES